MSFQYSFSVISIFYKGEFFLLINKKYLKKNTHQHVRDSAAFRRRRASLVWLSSSRQPFLYTTTCPMLWASIWRQWAILPLFFFLFISISARGTSKFQSSILIFFINIWSLIFLLIFFLKSFIDFFSISSFFIFFYLSNLVLTSFDYCLFILNNFFSWIFFISSSNFFYEIWSLFFFFFNSFCLGTFFLI